ncbi:MAG: hypothetical protein Q8P05_00300 [Candidatus Diapherotrites archaeon]|nr:hypothetical protein [Candidatus Diapherotrites archaeon]
MEERRRMKLDAIQSTKRVMRDDRHVTATRLAELRSEINQIRWDSPSEAIRLSRLNTFISDVRDRLAMITAERRGRVQAHYTVAARHGAALQAISMLPQSAREKINEIGLLELSEIIFIPEKYNGELFTSPIPTPRSHRDYEGKSPRQIRRIVLDRLRPYFKPLEARLFLFHFYRYFRAYTTPIRKRRQ